MVVEVDVAILQSWIVIGLTTFGGICTVTTVGLRLIVKPLTTALADLNATVKEINKDAVQTKARVADLEVTHRLRGCNAPIKGEVK